MRDVNDYCPKIVTILGSYVASVDSRDMSLEAASTRHNALPRAMDTFVSHQINWQSPRSCRLMPQYCPRSQLRRPPAHHCIKMHISVNQ